MPDPRMMCVTCTSQLVPAGFSLKTSCSIADADVGDLTDICQLRCVSVRMDRADTIFCTVIAPLRSYLHLSFVYCTASAVNLMYVQAIAALTCVRK